MPAAPLSGQGGGAGPEVALHEDAVDPAAEFEADRREQPDLPEAEFGMKADRGEIAAIADDGDHLAVPVGGAARDELRQQRPAHTLPLRLRRDIDRIFDG